jgi:hypothetical protein
MHTHVVYKPRPITQYTIYYHVRYTYTIILYTHILLLLLHAYNIIMARDDGDDDMLSTTLL